MRVLELGVRGTRPWEEEEVDVEHGGPGFGKQGLQTLSSLGLGLGWGQLISRLMSLPGARPWLCLPFTPVSATGTSKWSVNNTC